MKVPANPTRQGEGAADSVERMYRSHTGNRPHALAGPFYVDSSKPKLPARMSIGAGVSHCWGCGRQLQRAPGNGLGLFYFNCVIGKDGVEHRVHGFPCTQSALEDGASIRDVAASTAVKRQV